MERIRRLRAQGLLGCLAFVIIAADALPGSAAAFLGPTGDIVERFGADPRSLKDSQGKLLWFASGSWVWEPSGTAFSSGGRGAGSLLRMAGGHFTGTLTLRLRLAGQPSRARLLFAFEPATGAHRWLEIAAGNPGRVTLGQTGSLGESVAGVIQAWRTPVAAGVWQSLSLVIAGDKSVTVFLGGQKLFTAAAAPLVPGLVGFASAEGVVTFDEFTFTAKPDEEPCVGCHAGQADQPLAANVYNWWDGRRFDALYGKLPADQQGGHGDPGGKPALDCSGANGCHDMRQPQPGDHRNGSREGRGLQTENAYHLRSGFIVANLENPWDAQLVFDNYCTTACHPAAAVSAMSHELDSTRDPPLGIGGVTEFGDHSSQADGESLPVPVDSDITRRATPAAPDFAPCVSCHDPHGTGTADGTKSNRMMRKQWIKTSALCRTCH